MGQKLSVTKEEEKKFYEGHKTELEQPEQIRLSEILVSSDKKGDGDEAQQVAAAQAKAQDLLDKIHKGASFDDIAKKNSDGPTASQGGDLGYFRRGTLAKELEDKTFAMKPNDVSDVIRTKQGFVILRVSEHQMPGVPALGDVEPKVQDALYMQKLQPALRLYLQKLREEAFIEIKPGYVDTGASPNQTNPIETSEKEAAAKQLKKKKRFGLI